MVPRDDLARRKMLGILSSTWLAQGCYALAQLGIADAIGDGVVAVDDLAEATGTQPLPLLRLLRALALAGLLQQPEPGRFGLTPASTLLRRDVPGSVYLNAIMQGDQVYRAFAEITHTLRTGEPSFTKVYGMSFYEYLDANPEAARTFYMSMGAQPVPPGFGACDLSTVDTLVDVGGGNGALLAAVLDAYPKMRGVLVELPEAVALAKEHLAPYRDRVSYVEGSFFDGVPAGGDAYVLCRVVHNWRDAQALRLLHRVREAMSPGGRLIVLEEFLPDDGRITGGAGIVDLLMIVTQEGNDRTAQEYRALVEAAGFTVTGMRVPGAGDAGGMLEAIAT